MRRALIAATMIVAALASGGTAAGQAASAAPGAAASGAARTVCGGQRARFTVQTIQSIYALAPARLVVRGGCFAEGAIVEVWDYEAGVSLTAGPRFVAADASGRLSYTVPPVLTLPTGACAHLLQVRVRDVASNTLAIGNGKAYSPCQPPPPMAAS